MRGQKQLDFGWMPEPTPIGLPEQARRKLIRLMAAALLAVCSSSPKEGGDDELDLASEDRT